MDNYDLLFKNGNIIDGSGGAAYNGDVAVTGGVIAAVGPNLSGRAKQQIDISDRTICPGFIDIHRHADAAVFRPGFGEAELRQGITTIVNGNCGMSISPLPDARRKEMLTYLRPVLGDLPEELSAKPPLNVLTLAGSGSIRAAVCGYKKPKTDAGDIRIIHSHLEEILAKGAVGVSVGFSYFPDIYYNPESLAEALAPIKNSGLPLMCHIRGEGDLMYQSVQEAIKAAKLLKAPLHISHLKCVGKRNWGTLPAKVIKLIERQDDIMITCDVYPWTAGSTQMSCLLPPSFLRDGLTGVSQLLQDPKERAHCRDILKKPGTDFENIVELMGWQSIYISGLKSRKNRWCIGKSITEIADELQIDPYDAAFDLLAEENCDITMVDYITCEEDIATILKLSYSCVASDAIYPSGGLPHPRSYGNTSQLFKEYVQKRSNLSYEEAVYKLTALPAKIIGLTKKGLLKTGYDADLIIIGPKGLECAADYQNPTQYTNGIEMVMIKGEIKGE